MADKYIQAGSNLLEFSTSGVSNENLNLDLNLDACVTSGSNFINFGTAAPTSNTPGKIYIQI